MFTAHGPDTLGHQLSSLQIDRDAINLQGCGGCRPNDVCSCICDATHQIADPDLLSILLEPGTCPIVIGRSGTGSVHERVAGLGGRLIPQIIVFLLAIALLTVGWKNLR